MEQLSLASLLTRMRDEKGLSWPMDAPETAGFAAIEEAEALGYARQVNGGWSSDDRAVITRKGLAFLKEPG